MVCISYYEYVDVNILQIMYVFKKNSKIEKKYRDFKLVQAAMMVWHSTELFG